MSPWARASSMKGARVVVRSGGRAAGFGAAATSPDDNGKNRPWLEAEPASWPQPAESRRRRGLLAPPAMTWSGRSGEPRDGDRRIAPRVAFSHLTVGILTVRLTPGQREAAKEGSLSYEEEPPHPERELPFRRLRVVAGARCLQLIFGGLHFGGRRKRDGRRRVRRGRISPRRWRERERWQRCNDRQRGRDGHGRRLRRAGDGAQPGRHARPAEGRRHAASGSGGHAGPTEGRQQPVAQLREQDLPREQAGAAVSRATTGSCR